MHWDGAMYKSDTYPGVWVPYVDGYVSDSEHEYEKLNINAAKLAGTTEQIKRKYMMCPKIGLVRLK